MTRSCSPGTSCARLTTEVGVDPPGEHGVDLDVVAGPRRCERFGELDDAALARAVGGRERCAEDRQHRSDVDDLAAADALEVPDSARREQRNALVRLVSMTWRHSSSSSSCAGLRTLVPALFTRMSRRPQRRTASATSASTDSSLQTSTVSAIASVPSACRSRTAALDFSALRAATTTRAPALASPRAMPRPMPPFPPVTIATFAMQVKHVGPHSETG